MSDASNAAGTMMWDQPETEANAALSPASLGASKAANGFSAESSNEQDEADAVNGNGADSNGDPANASSGSGVSAAAAAAAATEFDLSGINTESPPNSTLLDLMAPSDAFLATSHPHSHHNASSSAAAAAAQAARDDPFGLSTLSGTASSTTSNVSSPGPSSPQSAKGTARHSANHSGSKVAPGSSPMVGPATNSAGLPAGMPSLSVSSSQENLFSVSSEASPVVSSATAAATSAAANPTGASSKPEKTVTGRLLRMFNPFSSSGSGAAAAAGVPVPVGSPNTQPMPAPSPPPSAGLGASAASTGVVSPTTPFTPFVSSTVQSNLPSSASSAALSTHQSPGGGALQLGTPIVPKSYSYQDFAAKMKLPGAQDLVKTLKNYVKQVQSPEWFAAHASHPSVLSKSSTEFDRIRTEYNDTITSIMRLIRTKHPLWKGASEEEIDNSLESIEKFLTSKLYDRFFPGTLFPQDRIQDAALADKLFKLHTWVRPSHLDLPAYCCADPSIWDHPSEELRNMDKFKSPRDKLVCLLNCCHIINNILKRAKQKENAEKVAAAEARRKARAAERERAERDAKNKAETAATTATEEGTKPTVTTDSSAEDLASPPPASSPISPPAGTTAAAIIPPGGSLASARRLSLEDQFVPSSSPSADDFFPALIYTLIHARPPHLYLNVVYISLCRYESKLSGGEAAYWYTNLASAIQFVENCGAKSFSFGKNAAATTVTTANATETDANATVPADKPTTHRKGASGSSAASALAAEEARAEYQRLMDQGEVLLREQRAAEAAEAAEVTRKADAAAAASAAAAEAKRLEQAESEAAAANAAVFMSAAAIDVMPPVPSVQAAAAAVPSATAGPAAAAAAAAAPASAFEHNHGPSSWPSGSSSALSGYLLPPPCIACLQLSHRRFAPRFLDREFSDLRVSELQDVLREYREMCFLIQGWQDHAAHKELRNLPLPARREHAASNAQDKEDGEGVALSAADASSAAPSSAHVAASSTAARPASTAASAAAAPLPQPPAAAPLGSWPLTNFLGLGMGRSKKS